LTVLANVAEPEPVPASELELQHVEVHFYGSYSGTGRKNYAAPVYNQYFIYFTKIDLFLSTTGILHALELQRQNQNLLFPPPLQ
jgi:hypothetical protein